MTAATDRPAIERIHPPDALIRFANPLLRRIIRSGRGGRLQDSLLVLHFTGRRTGKAYDIPAGYHDRGDHLAILTNSRWRHNFRGGRRVEVTLRGERRPALATLIDDPGEVAEFYLQKVEELGVQGAARRLGVRVNLDRAPDKEEWMQVIEREGLSIVRIDLGA